MRSSVRFCHLLVLVCASAPAFANGKAEIRARMLELDARLLCLREGGASPGAIESLEAELARLGGLLGGGRVHAPRAAAVAAPSESLACSPLHLVTSLPPGASATTMSFTGSGGALPDVTSVDFTLPVSGAGAYLWDVDLTTNIAHTWCGDLEIELFAPSGRRVTISNDNAEGYSNVFDGTLWDDSAPNSAYVYPFVAFTTATPLNSEGKFQRLIGDDPNGTWTLRINDDAGLDVGSLASWRLDLTTLAAPPVPPSSPTTFTSMPNLAVIDNAIVSDTLAVSGVGPSLAEARVRLALTHTYNADLLIDLIAPSGQTIRLASYIGAELDDVFDGTDIYDTASDAGAPLLDAPIALYPYVDGVAASAVNPEGTLASLNGTDPNGNWTLRIEDIAGGDIGNLASWELSIRTYGGAAPVPSSYCTSGTTTNGCVATISADAEPSVSFAHACNISVADVEGQKNAILFYGLAAHAVPWSASSSSFLCVKPPTQRTGALTSGGTSNACDGALALDWNAFQLAHPTALGAPWTVGDKAYVQAWFRDPPASKTTNLSDGLELTFQP